MKRPQKSGFLGPISSKITVTKEKERRQRRSEEQERRRREKKSNGFTLSFIIATLEIFAVNKLLDTKGRFRGNVFNNPARYNNF